MVNNSTDDRNTSGSAIQGFHNRCMCSHCRVLHGMSCLYKNFGDTDRKYLDIISVGYSRRWADGQDILSARNMKEQEG